MLHNRFSQISAHKMINVYYFPINVSQKIRGTSPEGLSGGRISRSYEVASSEDCTMGKRAAFKRNPAHFTTAPNPFQNGTQPTSKRHLTHFQNGTQPLPKWHPVHFKIAPDSFPRWSPYSHWRDLCLSSLSPQSSSVRPCPALSGPAS